MTAARTLLHFTDGVDTSGYFAQLARWHDRSRFRMLFGTLRPTDPALEGLMRSEGVPCFHCGCSSRIDYPLGLLRLARLLRRERVAILHTHLFDPSVVGLLAGTLAGTPTRLLTRHYSNYHTRIGKTWHVRLDRLCTRLSRAVIAVSQHTADHLVSVERAPREKVHVILNGIDFARVAPARDARDRIRRELAVDGGWLLVLVARLHPEKGQSTLFRALPELRRRVSRSVVVGIAGTGPFERAYRAEVDALGCHDMVRFLGFRQDATDLIRAADLVVLPSAAESFGLVLAEALHVGTPVVATRVGGIPEIVDDGVDGLLVPPGDPHALAEAIAGLLQGPERLSQMAGAGREKVERRFAFDRMIREYEALYDALAAQGAAR